MPPRKRYVFSASNLKALRLSAGLSRNELGFYAGVSDQSIYMYESGRQEPSASVFPGLIAALRCELIDLYELHTDEDPAVPVAGSS